ncbi:hypothetical protein UlMin_020462 [Ulmus minor]
MDEEDDGSDEAEEIEDGEDEEDEEEEEAVEAEDSLVLDFEGSSLRSGLNLEHNPFSTGLEILGSGNGINVNQVASDSDGPSRDRSVPVFLTDPDVFDCCICFETLTIPVFQCENGHIACSSCCTKLRNKCPSCSWPIGYNRCRAIEKVLESVKVECQNKKHGCKETVTYSKKNDHEKTCMYSSCSCPLSGCDFISSHKQLYLHFSCKHMDSAVCFLYNSNFDITLRIGEKFLVLQERDANVLFILSNNVECLGNIVTVRCIWPCSFRGFFYELLVKAPGNTLRLQSFTKSIQGRVDNSSPSTGFLLIPPDLFGSRGEIKLNLCIWRDGSYPCNFQRCIDAA